MKWFTSGYSEPGGLAMAYQLAYQSNCHLLQVVYTVVDPSIFQNWQDLSQSSSKLPWGSWCTVCTALLLPSLGEAESWFFFNLFILCWRRVELWYLGAQTAATILSQAARLWWTPLSFKTGRTKVGFLVIPLGKVGSLDVQSNLSIL